MLFINSKTKTYPLFISDLQAAMPTTAFPDVVTDDTLEGTDFAIVHETAQPEVAEHQVAVEGAPEFTGGRWSQTWTVEDHTPTQADLDALRTEAKSQIDRDAELQRMNYITPGAGQAAVYVEKAREAEAFLRGDSGEFPLLNAEVRITAETMRGVAEAVMATRAQWLAMAAKIEAARLNAKKAVDAATTPKAIQAAAGVLWPAA